MLVLEEREPKRLVERVSDSILIGMKFQVDIHRLLTYTIYYSKGEFFHNCWIEARIES